MSGCNLLTDLPSEILENVLSYLSYDEISKYRLVCRKFDTTCKVLLNHGFFDVVRRHGAILKKVRSLLPRRESERRTHPLARHLTILIAIETRINMLRLTFVKYIEKNACCFIPGKVLDEILRMLKFVDKSDTPPRAHEILQELRDISSMAMEHFDEKIAPNLKINPFAPPAPILSGRRLLLIKKRKEFKYMQQQNQAHKKQISYLKDVVSKLCIKVKNQDLLINHQTRKIREQSAKIKQQDNSIENLKRLFEKCDAQIQNLTKQQKCNNSATITSKAIVKSSIDTVGPSSTTLPIIYKPNIKPRKAQILSTPIYDIEHRKRRLETRSSSPIPVKLSRIDQDKMNLLSRPITTTTATNTNDLKLRYSDSALLKLPSFLTSGIETFLKSPISSIRSRKRKLQ